MWYITNIQFTATDKVLKELFKEFKNDLNCDREDEFIRYKEATVEWYYLEDDLKEFSKKFPNELIKVSGRGEDSEDVWVCYFQNGKIKKYSPDESVWGRFTGFDEDRKIIKKESFRLNLIEAVLQFTDSISQEESDTSEDRTQEEWWEEFKLYVEEV